MYELPVSITLSGKLHKIRNNGDFRIVLDCFSALEDVELSAQERLFASLIIFYDELETIDDIYTVLGDDLEQAVTEMYSFFNGGSESSQTHEEYKLVDWQQDEQLIVSAVNKVANTEIRAESYIHWWTFLSYYMAVGECALSSVIHIREKIVKGKKLEKYEQEFRRANPQYFRWNNKTIQAREAEELVRKLWNGGESDG